MARGRHGRYDPRRAPPSERPGRLIGIEDAKVPRVLMVRVTRQCDPVLEPLAPEQDSREPPWSGDRQGGRHDDFETREFAAEVARLLLDPPGETGLSVEYAVTLSLDALPSDLTKDDIVIDFGILDSLL